MIEHLARDDDSGHLGRPTVHPAEDSDLDVQGGLVDDDTHGRLENVLPGEGAVRIKRSVMEAALAALSGR